MNTAVGVADNNSLAQAPRIAPTDVVNLLNALKLKAAHLDARIAAGCVYMHLDTIARANRALDEFDNRIKILFETLQAKFSTSTVSIQKVKTMITVCSDRMRAAVRKGALAPGESI